MSKFINILILVVVVGGVAPFFIKDKEGKALTSFSKFKTPTLWTPSEKPQHTEKHDSTFDTLVFYKWQDKHGTWQYSNVKPEHEMAIEVPVNPNANMLQSLKIEMDKDKLEKRQAEENHTAKLPSENVPAQAPMTAIPLKDVPQFMEDVRALDLKMKEDLERQNKAIDAAVAQ